MDKHAAMFLLLGLLFTGAITLFLYMDGLNSAYGLSEGIVLKDPASFHDNSGRLNIVGVVDNNGVFPVDVTVGVNVTATTDAISTISTNGISSSDNSTNGIHTHQSHLCEGNLSWNRGPVQNSSTA